MYAIYLTISTQSSNVYIYIYIYNIIFQLIWYIPYSHVSTHQYVYSYYYIPIKVISFLQSRIALKASLSQSEISRMNSYLVT